MLISKLIITVSTCQNGDWLTSIGVEGNLQTRGQPGDQCGPSEFLYSLRTQNFACSLQICTPHCTNRRRSLPWHSHAYVHGRGHTFECRELRFFDSGSSYFCSHTNVVRWGFCWECCTNSSFSKHFWTKFLLCWTKIELDLLWYQSQCFQLPL